MAYLIAILVSLALFGGFLFLTAFERARGVRVLAGPRAILDRRVARLGFVIQHVDWGAFLKHMVQSAFARIVHDIAQFTLMAVRFVERLLTRIVRSLREQRSTSEAPTPRVDGLRATLVYFRKNLMKRRFSGKTVVHKEGDRVE